jgi:hypothetical protein
LNLTKAAGSLLQVLQVGGHAFARMFGAVQRIVHVALDGGNLRREISDEQPAEDRNGGEGQGHRTAKIVADIIAHPELLPTRRRNRRRTKSLAPS